tara:strand:+ start:1076 stop:1255 length:180 start_codon:yes stop_codon:yes gene_type:complete
LIKGVDMPTKEDNIGLERIKRAFIRELNSKILNENGKIQNAKLKLIDLNKQLKNLKGDK